MVKKKKGCWKHNWYIVLGLQVEVYGQDIFVMYFPSGKAFTDKPSVFELVNLLGWPDIPGIFDGGTTYGLGMRPLGSLPCSSGSKSKFQDSQCSNFGFNISGLAGGIPNLRRAGGPSQDGPAPGRLGEKVADSSGAISVLNNTQGISRVKNPPGHFKLLKIHVEAVTYYPFYNYPLQHLQ